MKLILIGGAVTALCCGGPLLIAALATTGVGATLTAFGWPTAGGAIALVGMVGGAWWLVRGRGRMLLRDSNSAKEVQRD